MNYLRPDLKRGAFSPEEEKLIVELHAVLGNRLERKTNTLNNFNYLFHFFSFLNRWSQIAARLPGRTDNEIKNLWNSSIKKQLRRRGIDPLTHKPISEVNENPTAVIIDQSCGSSEPSNFSWEVFDQGLIPWPEIGIDRVDDLPWSEYLHTGNEEIHKLSTAFEQI